MMRIVIVGGGQAGINCAQNLAKTLTEADNTEVVVLEKSGHFYHTLGAARACVDPDYAKNMFVPYDNAIPKTSSGFVRIEHAVATGISPDKKEISFQTISANDKKSTNTEKLNFDYLVLATGSTYTVPIKQDPKDYRRTTTEAKLQEVRSEIEKAGKILIVGGEAVGCEMAGQIKAKYREKNVTILEAHSELISRNKLSDNFYSKLHAALDAMKMAFWAADQGKFLAAQLAAVVQKKQDGFDKPYPKVITEGVILPVGTGGVSQLPIWGGVVVGDWVTWMIKAKDFMAGRTWGSLDATPPK
ncbi:hypothetical protein JG688_00015006 [Phytophthora aleatoria]|uniref:FAD/NAD(P)-binding domain-containing protein n=1 Tax=Phytophthora aleatoria TaxID=2496075 RepID=A0A8J5MD67_9STRA|nr:hypothetical protein JG688_00015006 [Phytophthora aleatoria]